MKISKSSVTKAARTAVPALVIAQAVAALFAMPSVSHAHGYVETPPDRIWMCRTNDNKDNPQSEGCRASFDVSGSTPFDNYTGNAQLGVRDNHKDYVPDGLLCAGGKQGWRGLDAVAAWTATPIKPDAQGNYTLHYRQTAQHISSYFRTYITKDSYDFSRPLRWDDLQLIGDTGWLDRQPMTDIKVKIPQGMTGKRVLYTVWQRDPVRDNAEAFYSCSDVDIVPSNVTWMPSGIVTGSTAKVGQQVVLRLFDKVRGGDVETHSLNIDANHTQAADWIYALAQKVNQASRVIKIGKMNANKEIQPVRSANENELFGNGKEYSFAIEVKAGGEQPVVKPPVANVTGPTTAEAGQYVELSAAKSSDPNGGKLTYTWDVPTGINASRDGAKLTFTAPKLNADQRFEFKVHVDNGKHSASAAHTVLVKRTSDGGNGGGDGGNDGNGGGGQHPAYQPGTAYQGGEIVSHGGKLYQCKPFPYAGWCGQAPAAYEPGKGWAWQDAWTLKP